MKLNLPHLPPSFYGQHAQLDVIRRAAQARRTPPDVVMLSTLCRVAASVPVTATVDGRPLNLIGAVVGSSGAGKSSGYRTACELIPQTRAGLDSVGVGSGEGMIQAYLRRQKIDREWKNVQVHDSVLFHVDEGEQLLQVSKRDGSTTLGVIRSAWDGGTLSTSGANADTTRLVERGRYRFVLLIGFQPDYAAALLGDGHLHAGTPQRFLWAAAGDPHAPQTPERFPQGFDLGGMPSGPIDVAKDVRDLIDDRRHRALKESGHDDPQETHALQIQVRVAALLNIVCHGGGRVTASDWNMAAELLDNSRQVRQALLDYQSVLAAEQKAAQVRDRVDQQEYGKDYATQQTLDRLTRSLGRHAKRHNQPATFSELTRNLNSRDRRLFSDAELAQFAIENRRLVKVENGRYVAGPNAE